MLHLNLNWKAAATVATGMTALASWLVTPEDVTARRPPAVPPRLQVTEAAIASIQTESARLAGRVRIRRPVLPARRNPFEFQSRAAGPKRRRLAAPLAQAEPPPAAPAPAPFPLRLSGTAGDTKAADSAVGTSGGDIVWTAIVSGGAAGLTLARVGDRIDGRYRVDRVDERSVEFVDEVTGRTVLVTLGAPTAP